MVEDTPPATFWATLEQATDPVTYKPQRRDHILASRLEANGEAYYVLKEPVHKSYLRLSENDYALWWQMDGQKSMKELLFYNLMRYKSLPIGHLKSLVANLRANYFLQDTPADMYTQITEALTNRAPASRGRRILDGFLHTEISIDGLDDFFTPFYQRVKWIFSPLMQTLLLVIILLGGLFFARLVLAKTYTLANGVGLGFITLFMANLLIIGVHEMAHGLTTKHFGRELNRGGFLIYWGFPAFFVDTRDTWLSPRQARVAVSWAGPHSGLILGGIAGAILTVIITFYPAYTHTIWAGFIYQIGFLAYLSVFVNLNPLLELDGYFILMDSLEMPGLRERAFLFWRQTLWPQIRDMQNPVTFWRGLSRTERIFMVFGGLALIYSTYALILAIYFWRTRLWPVAIRLWQEYGWGGQFLLLIITAVLVMGLYYLLHFGWSRIQAGLAWLARHNLLARPDVLALLTGVPLIAGLPLLLINLPVTPQGEMILNLIIWLLHIGTTAVFIGIARQLPGSRFQWTLWSLAAATITLTAAWVTLISPAFIWHELALLATAATILAAGMVAWFTVAPTHLHASDKGVMGLFLLIGFSYAAAFYGLQNGHYLTASIILTAIFLGLILLAPLIINFWRSYFALPWFLLIIAILTIPWLLSYPALHLPVITIWFYTGLLYLLLGTLAEFKRHEELQSSTAIFSERQRLVNSFNHFMEAMFTTYETIFGGRRLAMIQTQMLALGPLDPDANIFELAKKCRSALLLAVDRLDDLAGTPFTHKVGQAAYDSLPWLEAETLGRHVLADTKWGSQLAQGFIHARDSRENLIRQADIFAGFDQDGVQEVMNIIRTRIIRPHTTIAQAHADATQFFLIESGKVGAFSEGEQLATLTTGGYFGMMALQDTGHYFKTYRALTTVHLLIIDRHRFDPLLRADTTLAQQVTAGHKERELLKKMLLFSSLSPQELATIDAQLQHRRVQAGEIIVQQDQPRSHLIIVAEGQVEIVYENEASTQVLGTLGPGEHFGEYALFANTPYPATCRAVTDSRLLLLDEPTFDQLVAHYEHMSHYVEQIGSGRLIATRRRLGPSTLL